MQALRGVSLIGLLGCIAGIGLAGCPASSAGTKTVKKTPVDAGFDAGSEDAGVYCPPGVMTSNTFMINAESSSTPASDGGVPAVTARLSAAKPNPPDRYNNLWTIDLLDASGNPIEDASITKAYANMPYHGHGKPAYSVTKMSDPGRFQVGLNFFMPGDFEVQLTVASKSAGNAFITFKYCVE